MNSFLFESPNTSPLDGILLDHRPSCIARCDPTSTDARGDAEEAQESKPSKAYAWKRRRKRQDEEEQKTAYEIMSGDWSSDVCSSDLGKRSTSTITLQHVEEEDVAMSKG